MKKILLILAGLLLTTTALAQVNSLRCGYQDVFLLSSSSPAGLRITGANTDESLKLHVIGPRNFKVKDTNSCATGYGHVTIASSDYNWCVLNIKDGPYLWHPEIDVSCKGLKYEGMVNKGSHEYLLNFSELD